MMSKINPIHWTREHQFAWVVIIAIGAIAGALLGFIHSPLFMSQTWRGFTVWLSFPDAYWPWPLLSFLITAVTFYAVQLVSNSD
jgi:hypothetical protein